MQRRNRLMEEIRSLMNNQSFRFSFFEEGVDVEIQTRFLSQFNQQQKEPSDRTTDEWLSLLNKESLGLLSIEEQEGIILEASHVDEVAVYRALEKLVNELEGDMKSWAVLGMQHSRMLLQSVLLDEYQVFVSTGLGGRNNKIRYYAVLAHSKGEVFSERQQEIIQSESLFAFNQSDAELEAGKFDGEFYVTKVLIPMTCNLDDLFQSMINASVDLGVPLHFDYLITNVKELNRGEMESFFFGRNNPQHDEEQEP